MTKATQYTSGPWASSVSFESRLECAATADEVEDQRDDGKHDQDVDPATEGGSTDKADEP